LAEFDVVPEDGKSTEATLSPTKACEWCGQPLATDATDKLCPRCIAKVGAAAWLNASPDEPPEAKASASPAFGDYELLEEVGRGGMGVVFKARQKSLRRLVALKLVLQSRLSSAAVVRRFQIEAEAAAQLDHPNIVPIHEVGEYEGQHFYSMKLVEGVSLAGKLREGPLSPPQAAQCIAQIARAIHYAHQHGVIHRDLKPGNILLDAAGAPHVTDFGLAKIAAFDSGLTLTEMVLGSPAYMAPEQASGKARQATTAADVYSLGAVLYECLTGQPPFRADTVMETLRHVAEHEPERPSLLRPETDRDLETVCLKCLQKEPNHRYATALNLAEDLERWLRHEPVQARPVGRVEALRLWAQRNPRVAALTGLALLLLFVIAVGASIGAWRLRLSEGVATQRLYQSLVAQAQANRWSGRVGRRFSSLEALTQAAELRRRLVLGEDEKLRLRNEVIACLAQADVRLAHEWRGRIHPDYRVGIDGAFRHYARGTGDGGISVRRVADDGEVNRLGVPGENFGGSFISPDGRFAGYKTNPAGNAVRCVIWNVAGREIRLNVPSRSTTALAFSADSRWAALDQPDRSVLVANLETGELRALSATEADPNWLRFSPSGRKLAVSSFSPGVVQVWDLANGSFTNLNHPDAVLQIAWRPDEKILAAACKDKQIHLWDVESGRVRAVLAGHESTVQFVDFHPDGRLLSSWASDGTSRLWDTARGAQLLVAPGQQFHGFSADGRQLLSSAGLQLSLWEVDTAVESRSLAGIVPGQFAAVTTRVSFDPLGRWLAAAVADGVYLWPLPGLEETKFLPLPQCRFGGFRPSDGRLITVSEGRIQLWPFLPPAGVAPDALPVGPPERIDGPSSARVAQVNQSADGRTLALALRDPNDIVLMDLAKPGVIAEVKRCFTFGLAVSSDARWVASGNWQQADATVWSVETGQRVLTAPTSGSTTVTFSPDNRWLVTSSSEECRLWEVGSWRQAHAVSRRAAGLNDGPVAFSPDGKVLALTPSIALVKLVDAATGRELAALDSPETAPIIAISFSADGHLLAVGHFPHSIRVWDLRRIRARLAAMNLDWQ
jgi:WD40 repeat protein/tRNA A-37 threonylcarbamoyl transferase component Bud32